MRIYVSCFALAVILLCGCASDHFTAGHGDVGQFIVQKAVASGASVKSTNTTAVVGGHWRYFEDQHGVVIHMPPEQNAALERFLLETFGQPKVAPTETPNGARYGMYRFAPEGGAIHFGLNREDGAHIEVIHPLTRQESVDAVIRALKDEQVQKALGEPQ